MKNNFILTVLLIFCCQNSKQDEKKFELCLHALNITLPFLIKILLVSYRIPYFPAIFTAQGKKIQKKMPCFDNPEIKKNKNFVELNIPK